MSNKRKALAAGIAILFLLAITALWQRRPAVSQGMKQINVVIDAQDWHADTTITTDKETLKEMLLEQTQWHVQIEDGPYGAFLTSLADHKQDLQSGPWWIYTSPNNQICQAQGMCPSLDQVSIQNGDSFHFTLTMEIE